MSSSKGRVGLWGAPGKSVRVLMILGWGNLASSCVRKATLKLELDRTCIRGTFRMLSDEILAIVMLARVRPDAVAGD